MRKVRFSELIVVKSCANVTVGQSEAVSTINQYGQEERLGNNLQPTMEK